MTNYIVGSTTGGECSAFSNDSLTDKYEYWKVNAYYKIMDNVIMGMKRRFSPESLNIGIAVDNFINLKYEESFDFINKYEV